MTNESVTKEQKLRIDSMSQEEMARLHRFAPPGHEFFQRGPLNAYFMERFKALGGMTLEISKRIGWD